MLRRYSHLIKRFNHKHSDKANSFLPKNDFKIEYDKCHESEDKLNENIQDIKKSVENIEFCIEMTSITVCSYAFGQIIAAFLFK